MNKWIIIIKNTKSPKIFKLKQLKILFYDKSQSTWIFMKYKIMILRTYIFSLQFIKLFLEVFVLNKNLENIIILDFFFCVCIYFLICSFVNLEDKFILTFTERWQSMWKENVQIT